MIEIGPEATAIRYVPILKAKLGEFSALADLAPAIKPSIVPLLEVPPIPWDYENEAPAKAIDAHVGPVVEKIRTSWGSAQIAYLDLDLLADEVLASGTHPVEALFGEAAAAGLMLIPVAGVDRSAADIAAVAAVVARDGRGMCLRLVPDDLLPGQGPSLSSRIDAVLAGTGTTPPTVDLILDLGAIPTGQAAVLTIAWSAVIPTLPYLDQWRTFTLAATAFPAALTGMPGGSITPLTREEWQLYQTLVGSPLARRPDFGDYAIAHPELADVDPRLMQMSASIRYATDSEWLIVKGRSVRRLGFEQTRELSRLLLARPEARPAAHCAGCSYITRRATGAVSSGNATTWRRVGTIHHLTTVVEQLTILNAP